MRPFNMVASAFLLLALSWQAQSAERSPNEVLFEVPTRFVSGCPIVSFDLASELKGKLPLEFILDSGTTRSLLLNEAEGRARTLDPGRRGLLIPGQSTVYAGSQDFAAPNLAQFNQDLIDRLLSFHVQGMLGADFLTTHDVLIDYGARRVFVSRSRDAREAPSRADRRMLIGSSSPGRAPTPNGALNRQCLVDGIRAADVRLAARGHRVYVSANLVGDSSQPWEMRVDTWATRSTVPKAVAAGLKRTGVSERISASGSTFNADQVEATISISKGVDLSMKPVATEETESILGSDAFQGHTLLLQFGRARLRLWNESVLEAFGASR